MKTFYLRDKWDLLNHEESAALTSGDSRNDTRQK